MRNRTVVPDLDPIIAADLAMTVDEAAFSQDQCRSRKQLNIRSIGKIKVAFNLDPAILLHRQKRGSAIPARTAGVKDQVDFQIYFS